MSWYLISSTPRSSKYGNCNKGTAWYHRKNGRNLPGKWSLASRQHPEHHRTNRKGQPHAAVQRAGGFLEADSVRMSKLGPASASGPLLPGKPRSIIVNRPKLNTMSIARHV